jgi:signal transduction histidine kinase/ActR/RegA family two-component response regulator
VRNQHDLFRRALDALASHVCVLDGDGTITAVNRAWREFARANGPVRGNVAEGANYLVACDPGDATAHAFADGVRAVLRGERDEFSLEYPCHTPGGEQRWFVGRVTRLGGAGKAGAVVAHENVTGRRRAEDRLREQTDVNEALHRIGRILGAELDLDNLVQVVTDEATRLTEARFGAFFHNAVGPGGESFLLYALSGVPRSAFAQFPMPRPTDLLGQPLHGQGVVRLDDVTRDPRFGKNPPYNGLPPGHLPVRSYLAVPVVSRSGEVLGGLFFGHERAGVFAERHERLVSGVAALAAVAIDNARLYEQARRVGDQLRQRNEDLAAAARRKDEFLTMLAHELRNPLAPISNGLHILKSAVLDPGVGERARDMMERQIKHMTHIVDDLLEVSRLTRGRINLQTERLDLTRLAREAAEDHRPDFDRAGVAVDVFAPEVPVWVVGDSLRLTQVLDNLLENAVKFSSPGGRVTVRAEKDEPGNRAVVIVKDTGVGIDPELLPRLFDAFAQADRSLDRAQGGLGLGLTLVKGLVELHGGRVKVASAGRGHGAEFTVALPASPEPAVVAHLPAAAHCARKRLRILVVEDNRDSAETLRMLLQMFGHEVTVAYSGIEGVEAAKRLHPEVVLCDIGLPGMDGYGVVGALRRDPETAGARVIAVTGYGAEEDRRRSQQAGFDLHLTKPLDPDALEEVFSEVVVGHA